MPSVQHIDVPQGNTKRRLIAFIAFIAIALVAFGLGISGALSHGSGWTEIKTRTGSPGCGEEFSFHYCLDEKNTTAQYRTLTALYTTYCERAANVFGSESAEEIGNLYTVNIHPNETVQVEPELYRALRQIQQYGNRIPYLAPLYESYSSLFFCTEDYETAAFDPAQDPELAAIFSQLASFANDPDQIDLTFPGENQVMLRVSPAYLTYAAENGVEQFVDLGWMKNAFIADMIASELRAGGYTHGYLQSYEGFGVTLDETGTQFSMNVYDRLDTGASLVAEMTYTGPLTYASLRSFSINPTLGDWYYEWEDGRIASIFVDPTDGQPKTALDELVVWSGEQSCGELLLQTCPVFIADQFDDAALTAAGVSFLTVQDHTILYNDPATQFVEVADGYTPRQAG